MQNTKIFRMAFASVYPHYITKEEMKIRTKAEAQGIMHWLTRHALFQLIVLTGLMSCSSPQGDLEGIWSGRTTCSCQEETMTDDGVEGEVHFEFWRDGTFQTWMDPKEEGAWGMDGEYRVEGDTLKVKHQAARTWNNARILMMTADSIVYEEVPRNGCICTSWIHRETITS